jgi:hypothetical protein
MIWGYSPSYDLRFHASGWIQVLSQWKEGIAVPQWSSTANFGLGEPKFVFYPPFTVYVGAALLSFLPLKIAPGAFIWLVEVIAALSMYKLAVEFLPSRWALLSAALFVFSPYILADVYVRFSISELVAIAFFPTLLLGVYRLAADIRLAPLVAIGVAATTLADIPTVLVIDYTIAVVAIVLCYAKRSMWPLLRVGMAGLLGTALCGFYLAPGMFEAGWIRSAELELTPLPTLLFMTRPRNPWEVFILPLTIGYVALGIFILLRWKRSALQGEIRLVIAAITLFAVVMLLPVSRPIWMLLPRSEYIQFACRWLAILSVTTSFGLSALLARKDAATGKYGLRCFLLIAGFVILYTVTDYYVPGPLSLPKMRTAIETGTEPSFFLPLHAVRPSLPERIPEVTFSSAESTKGSVLRVLQSRPDRKTVEVNAVAPTAVALRLFYYPRWHVLVNKVRVDPLLDSRGAILVPVPQGKTAIEVVFVPSPGRKTGAAVTGAALVVLIFMSLVSLRTV